MTLKTSEKPSDDIRALLEDAFERIELLESAVANLELLAPNTARALSVNTVREIVAADPTVVFEVLSDFATLSPVATRFRAGQTISAQQYPTHIITWAQKGMLLAPPRAGSDSAISAIKAQVEARAQERKRKALASAKAEVDSAKERLEKVQTEA